MKKLLKMGMIKFVLKVLDQKYFMAILKSINRLLTTYRNFDKFYLLINTPGCNIAKFLIPILEPLTHNEFTIKDSFSFAKEIRTYDSSSYMAILDAKCLFTNIPLNETITNCVSDLQNKNLHNGKLSKRYLFKLLETATLIIFYF